MASIALSNHLIIQTFSIVRQWIFSKAASSLPHHPYQMSEARTYSQLCSVSRREDGTPSIAREYWKLYGKDWNRLPGYDSITRLKVKDCKWFFFFKTFSAHTLSTWHDFPKCSVEQEERRSSHCSSILINIYLYPDKPASQQTAPGQSHPFEKWKCLRIWHWSNWQSSWMLFPFLFLFTSGIR